MFYLIFKGIFLYKFTLSLAKEAELPLCPTNVLYFPQNLPMHCRMPTQADYLRMGAPTVPPFFQSPPPDKQPLPIPFPVPPGHPGPMPLPGNVAAPGAIPIPPPPPGAPMPFPGPIPMPLPGGPAHKLPVIVMPFYSPDPSFKTPARPKLPFPHRPKKWKIRHKRRRPSFYPPSDTDSSSDTDISTDTSSSSSSEYRGWWKDRRNHRRFNRPNKTKKIRHHNRQLLTPILQYVTKDGYVIFEKKISKNEAKDWMSIKKDEKAEPTPQPTPELTEDSSEHNSREKEMMAKGNAEVLNKRNSHRPNRIKLFKDKNRN